MFVLNFAAQGRGIFDAGRQIFNAYGSFFGLSHPVSRLIIVFVSLVNPAVGLYAMAGAAAVRVWREVLGFYARESAQIEMVNGMLLGLLMGSMYAVSVHSFLLLLAGCLAVVLVSAVLYETAGRYLRLPILGLPYGIAAYIMIPLAGILGLYPAYTEPSSLLTVTLPGGELVRPFGAIYFNGSDLGGWLVFLAFVISSPYLGLLALLASGLCGGVLSLLQIHPHSLSYLVAQMNGVLTAAVIGGLYAGPGRRSVIVSLCAACAAVLICLAGQRLLAVAGLPVLAMPFVICTWAALIALSPARSTAWLHFWLPSPMLPEQSTELMSIARARGVDPTSVALKLPLVGTWQIYQGFMGGHTHIGPWQYALDFFKTSDGKSYFGSGRSLTDYFAFGRPVLSPVYGRVVAFENNVADNVPGDVDTKNNWGNFIVIELPAGACVVLAHLQKGSVKVSVDSYVNPGQILASCGNSGRSPQPHLHMHVQENRFLGSRTIPFHLTDVMSALTTGGSPDSAEVFSYSLNLRPAELSFVTAPTRNPSLRKAMHLSVGNWLEFEVTQNDSTSPVNSRFQVVLDLYGQFYLESTTGARVAFTLTDELLSFYGRNEVPDLALDGLILGLGVTPVVEGVITWKDCASRRLLPMGIFRRTILSFLSIIPPFGGCMKSTFFRTWNSDAQVWFQTARHSFGSMTPASWQVSTQVELCESSGILSYKVARGGRTLLSASLARYGLREDNGIPEEGRCAPVRCHEGKPC